MNLQAAQDTIKYSLERLSKRLNTSIQQLQPKYISSDIIMNGALAVIRKRDWEIDIEIEKNKDNPHQNYLFGIKKIASFPAQVKQNSDYTEIVTNFKQATRLTFKRASSDDALYVEEEIYKVLQNEYGPAEDVLNNYFKQYHGITLFDNDDDEDENDDY